MKQDEQILQTLRDMRDDEEGELFAFYERLLRAIIDKKEGLSLAEEQLVQAGEATNLARAGKPHLQFDALELEANDFYPWLLEVAQLFEESDPGVMDEMEGIDAEESIVLARQWFEEGFTERGATVDALLANAMRPYLERSAEILLPLLPMHIWDETYCPVCGGLPDFAVWDEEQTTELICERCAAMWEAPVVGCLFCGETDPEARGVYSSEDELYLVEVCDNCGSYLKGINRAQLPSGSEPLLAAERLLTPGLDMLAIQEGYVHPVGIGGREENE